MGEGKVHRNTLWSLTKENQSGRFENVDMHPSFDGLVVQLQHEGEAVISTLLNFSRTIPNGVIKARWKIKISDKRHCGFCKVTMELEPETENGKRLCALLNAWTTRSPDLAFDKLKRVFILWGSKMIKEDEFIAALYGQGVGDETLLHLVRSL